MKWSFAALATGMGLALGSTSSMAQSTTQTVTFQVTAINEIAIAGSAPSLTVSTATAGSAPTAVSSSGLTWAITTNQSTRRVTAALDSNMPSDVTLALTLGAPTNATSAGAVSLSTVAQNVVTGISTLNESGLALTYQLSATAAAGVVPSDTRTVTLTITS